MGEVNRICFVCRKGESTESLLRFSLVRSASEDSDQKAVQGAVKIESSATLVVDGATKHQGRGAYCHPRSECLKHRGFEGKLRYSLFSMAGKSAKEKRTKDKGAERSGVIIGSAELALRAAWSELDSRKKLPGVLVGKQALGRSKVIETALRFFESSAKNSAMNSSRGAGAEANLVGVERRVGGGKTLPGMRQKGKK